MPFDYSLEDNDLFSEKLQHIVIVCDFIWIKIIMYGFCMLR